MRASVPLLLLLAAAAATSATFDLSACDNFVPGTEPVLPVSWSLATSPWPHEAACRPFAVSTPGSIDFYESLDATHGATPPFVIRTANASAIVAFNGFQTVPEWKDPADHSAGTSNLQRGTTGDFAPSVRLAGINATCTCAATMTAMLLEALPCDFYISDGYLADLVWNGLENVYAPLTLNRTGVYCSAIGDLFSVIHPLTLIGNATDRYIFKGLWNQLADAGTASHVILQGGLLPENVINVARHTLTDYASYHGLGVGGTDKFPCSANMTFISDVPFHVSGNAQVGRVLMTQMDEGTYGTSSLKFYGVADVLLTANTSMIPGPAPTAQQQQQMSSTGAAGQTSSSANGYATAVGSSANWWSSSTGAHDPILISPITLPAETSTTFAVPSVSLFVRVQSGEGGGTFTAALSELATNRSSDAVLRGRLLQSPVLTFTFDPPTGLRSATLSINVSQIAVATGRSLQWHKFNTDSGDWDRKGGELDAATGLLAYTTDSFSDWALLETDTPESPGDAWWSQTYGLPVAAWIAVGALLLPICVLLLCVRCVKARRSRRYAKLARPAQY